MWLLNKNSTFHRDRGNSACSTGDSGIFYQKIIEIFITVNGQGQFLPEGPGGGKGYKDREAVFNLTALRTVEGTGGSP